MQVVDPLVRNVPPSATGLNFGSGPSPVLSDLLREKGLNVSDYDPLYAPGAVLNPGTYEFIACCETVEHFRDPERDWKVMAQLLVPGGCLAVKTYLYGSDTEFSAWRYANDETHICFYSERTMSWIAADTGLNVVEGPANLTVFRKPGIPGGIVEVYAAVIQDRSSILIAGRELADGSVEWEFPGGKSLPGETPSACLRREILEELGMSVDAGKCLGVDDVEKGGKRYRVFFHECRMVSGAPVPREHHSVKWVDYPSLLRYTLSSADMRFARRMAIYADKQ